jgi:hypothetical protein
LLILSDALSQFDAARAVCTGCTEVVRETEAVAKDLPGNLAEAAGHLLRRLATESVARTTMMLRASE